jgi:hypothetical protein
MGSTVGDHSFHIYQLLVKKWCCSKTIHQLFIDFKKASDSVRRKELYNILLQFKGPTKLVRLIKSCLNVTYSKDNII